MLTMQMDTPAKYQKLFVNWSQSLVEQDHYFATFLPAMVAMRRRGKTKERIFSYLTHDDSERVALHRWFKRYFHNTPARVLDLIAKRNMVKCCREWTSAMHTTEGLYLAGLNPMMIIGYAREGKLYYSYIRNHEYDDSITSAVKHPRAYYYSPFGVYDAIDQYIKLSVETAA